MGTTEPTSGTAGDATPPSAEDDIRDYAQRIRSLPVQQIIGDVIFTMLGAAQAKLGRRDARLLIDSSTLVHQHARPVLPDSLTKQVDDMLGQLRLSQVSAEGQAGHPGEQAGPPGEKEENDLDRVPAPPPAEPQSGG